MEADTCFFFCVQNERNLKVPFLAEGVSYVSGGGGGGGGLNSKGSRGGGRFFERSIVKVPSDVYGPSARLAGTRTYGQF